MARPLLPVHSHGPGAGLVAAVQLMAPATALGAAADAVAGLAVAWGLWSPDLQEGLLLLPLAAFFLSAGGSALGDVRQAGREGGGRPHRPIAQGFIPRSAAALWSFCLLAAGIGLAALYGRETGGLAILLTGLLAAHACRARGRLWFGPLCQALGRAGYFLLGMAASPEALDRGWFLAAIPLAYMMAIALIGRGRGRQSLGYLALGLVVLVAEAHGILAAARGQWPALVFVALFAALVWPAFHRASLIPSRATVRRAVKTGMANLVVCDAVFAAAFAGPVTGLAVLLLLPLAWGLGRVFPAA